MPTWRRRLGRSARGVGFGVVGLLVLEYLVLPQLAGARESLHLLARVNVAYLLGGVALEGGAIVCYAELTRSLLPKESRPHLFDVLRMNMTTLAVSHLVPGGTAAGTSLGYRLLTTNGVPGPDAGFALATQGIGSAVVLNVLLWIGLLVSIPTRGFNPVYLTAAIVGAVLLAFFGALIFLLTRGEDRAASILRAIACKIPLLDEAKVEQVLRRLAARLDELAADRRLLRRAVLWALANWALDAASLWVFVAAFGYRILPDGLIVAFGLANVLAAIPLTPGGLGVVEAVLTSSLVGFGAPRGVAILGVISYRLVNFWLPIPLGGLGYVSLQYDKSVDRRRAAAELRRLAQEARQEVGTASEAGSDDPIKSTKLSQ
ncbi:MAG: flippase-like domain-containing protein [Actinobacteria bacterium]|nr:flippase-like domain-containing protein [Actinomycetota bacterium]MBV9933863.1 flippase-like domain-containing protein [Actinomycetota bacterium]